MTTDNLTPAAARVDFRLTFARTDEPRHLHAHGIAGPRIANSYHGHDPEDDTLTGRTAQSSGSWEDPDHPGREEPEQAHIDRWFVTAVREAIHEALEWYRVDDDPYLDPHGWVETEIHDLSEKFALDLLALREKELLKNRG